MGLFIKKKYLGFSVFCFQNIMTCLSYPTAKLLFKVKNKNTILICWLWSKATTKTPELCHAVFIFNFEHIHQINLIFFIINFEQLIIKFASCAQDKIRKIS